MPPPRRPGVLDPLRVRVRRFQLVVGLGFLALVMGHSLSLPLAMRLGPRLSSLGSEFATALAGELLRGLWLWAALPAVCYGAARLLDLKPWSTAIGASLTGGLFNVAVVLVSAGVDGLVQPWPVLVMQLAITAAGVVLTRTAVVSARAAAAKAEAASAASAAKKKGEYEEFAAEAERLAAMREPAAPAPASAPPSPSGEPAATPPRQESPAAPAPASSAPPGPLEGSGKPQ